MPHSHLHLEVVTPRGPAVALTDVSEVILPGKLGEFGVLPGHVPFLSALRPGVISYKDAGGAAHRLAVGKGFAEVGAASKILVLIDAHAHTEEIDVGEVRQELADLEAELKAWSGELTAEHEDLVDKAAWARARLDCAGAVPR